MRKLVIVFLTVSLFAACNNKKPTKWTSAEKKEFLNSCIPAAERNGLTKSQATQYCECNQQGLEKMYPDGRDVAKLDMNSSEVKQMIEDCHSLAK